VLLARAKDFTGELPASGRTLSKSHGRWAKTVDFVQQKRPTQRTTLENFQRGGRSRGSQQSVEVRPENRYVLDIWQINQRLLGSASAAVGR